MNQYTGATIKETYFGFEPHVCPGSNCDYCTYAPAKDENCRKLKGDSNGYKNRKDH